MNQADKEEALRLLHVIDNNYGMDGDSIQRLRDLITRQKPDEDGERWRFCLEHGFPWSIQASPWNKDAPGWLQSIPSKAGKESPFSQFGKTPNEATDAARAAMKGTA